MRKTKSKGKNRKQQIISLLTVGFGASCPVNNARVLYEVKASKKQATKKNLEQKSVKVKTHTSPKSGGTTSALHLRFLRGLLLRGKSGSDSGSCISTDSGPRVGGHRATTGVGAASGEEPESMDRGRRPFCRRDLEEPAPPPEPCFRFLPRAAAEPAGPSPSPSHGTSRVK